VPKYDLQYKLSRGDVLRYEVTHQASISGTSDKTTQTAQSKTDSVKSWKVTDVLPSGDIEFMNVCERVRMMNQLPDRKATEYDSTRDTTAPPGFEDTAKAVGVPLSTMRITTHGKVLNRQVKVHNQARTTMRRSSCGCRTIPSRSVTHGMTVRGESKSAERREQIG